MKSTKKCSNAPTKKSRRLPRYTDPRLYFPPMDGGGRVSVTVADAVQITGSAARTVNRWRRCGAIPPAPLMLLQLHHAGFIVPPDWRRRGFGFNSTGLLCVGHYVFRSSELEGYGVVLATLRELSADRARRGPDAPALPLLTVLRGGRS